MSTNLAKRDDVIKVLKQVGQKLRVSIGVFFA